MKTHKTNQFFTRALALVVMLLSMGVGSVWGDTTIFSYEFGASIAKNAVVDQSDGTMTLSLSETTTYKENTPSETGAKLKAATDYVKVSLKGNTFAVGDKINVSVWQAGTSSAGDTYGIYINSTNSSENAVYEYSMSSLGKNTIAVASYTITSTDALKGKTDFYILGKFPSGKNVFVEKIEVTRSGGEESTPSFTTQPATTTNVTAGSITGSLTVAASNAQSYAWYQGSAVDKFDGTTSLGTGTSFTIPTSLTEGAYYYYCTATNTTKTANSTMATVNVAAAASNYDVKFYTDNGTTQFGETKSVASGEKAAEPGTTAPTKDGYTFVGWSKTYGGAAVTVSEQAITAAQNFYACWSENPAVATTTTWDFSIFSAALISADITDYNGIKIVQNKGSISTDFVSKNGARFNGSSSSSIRYIEFTPMVSGTMEVTGKANGSNNTRTIYVGTTLASTSSGVLKSAVASTSGTTISDISLTAGTTYYVYVNGGGITITKLEYTKKIATALAVPSNLGSSDVTSSGAKLTWDKVANASSYKVKIGETEYDADQADAPSYSATGLTANTEYSWQVKAIGDGVNYTSSDYSASANFTTTTAPTEPDFSMTTPSTAPTALADMVVSGGSISDNNSSSKVSVDANGVKFGSGSNQLLITLNKQIQAGTKITIAYKNTSSSNTTGLGVFDGNVANQVVNVSEIATSKSDVAEYTFTSSDLANYTNKLVITRNGGSGGMAISEIKIYGLGSALPVVTFHKNDGADPEVTATQSVPSGVETALNTLATIGWTRDYYTFDGWATSADGEVVYADGANITTSVDVPLYAHWTPGVKSISVKAEPTRLTYKVGQTFNPEGLYITKTMGDNSSSDVAYSDATAADFSFSPDLTTALTTSDKKVTITYGGKSVDKSITVEAYTVDDLTVIADDIEYTPSATLATGTMTADGHFLAAASGDNTYGNSSGKIGWVVKSSNRVFAFKVNKDAKVTLTHNVNDSRSLYLGSTSGASDLSTSTTGTLAYTATDAKTLYVSASGDLYVSKIAVSYATGYTVTYDLKGHGTAIDPAKNVTALPNPLPTPEATGYTFGGWFTDDELTTAATAGATISDNTTLYAKWTANQYTATFNNNDETESPATEDITETYDANYILPTTIPVRSGYGFTGWFTDKTAGTQVTANDKVAITEATTFYAHWTEIQYATDIDFAGNAATAPAIANFCSGHNMTISVGSTSAWDSGNKSGFVGYKIKDDAATLKFWMQSGKRMTVTLGSCENLALTIGGIDQDLSANNVKGDNQSSTFEYTATSNVEVVFTHSGTTTATFKAITFVTPAPSHSVTYALGAATGGTVPTQADVEENKTFTVAAVPADLVAPDGQQFKAWNDGSNDYVAGSTYTMGTADVTLTAQYEPIPKSAECRLTEVVMSNGMNALIDNTAHTVKAYYMQGEAAPTVSSHKQSDKATYAESEGKITVTAENGTDTQDYTFTIEAVAPYTTIGDVTFTDNVAWIKGSNGYQSSKGNTYEILKSSNEGTYRIELGLNRAYLFVGPCKSVTILNNYIDYSNDRENSTYAVNGGAKTTLTLPKYNSNGSSYITIPCDEDKNNMIEIVNAGNGSWGFGKVTLAKAYAITCQDAQNGSVKASEKKATKGTTITLTVTPNEGYELNTLTVKDAGEQDVELTGYQFTMPESDVTVTATFRAEPVYAGMLIKAVVTAGDKAAQVALEGTPGGTADVGLSKAGKLESNCYFGIKLADGHSFKKGDVVTISLTSVGGSNNWYAFNSKTASDATKIYSSSTGGKDKELSFTLDSDQPAIYFVRNSTYSWNPTFGSVTVSRTYHDKATITLGGENSQGYWGTYSSSDITFIADADVNRVPYSTERNTVGLSALPKEVVTIDGDEVTGTFLPANTGVLLNNADATVNVWTVTNKNVDEVDNNYMRPVVTSITASDMNTKDANSKFYMLSYDDYTIKSDLGFYWGADNGAAFAINKAHVAYLAIPKNNNGQAPTRFVFGQLDTTPGIQTGLDAISANGQNEKFFQNGRLYIRHNGILYDASGMKVK